MRNAEKLHKKKGPRSGVSGQLGNLYRYTPGDAVIVGGSVLEKHFDGDFIPDQEKKITSNVGHRGTKADNLAWHSTG